MRFRRDSNEWRLSDLLGSLMETGKRAVVRVFFVTAPLNEEGAIARETTMRVLEDGTVDTEDIYNLYFDDSGYAVGPMAIKFGVVARCSDCGRLLAEAGLARCFKCNRPLCAECVKTLSSEEGEAVIHCCDTHHEEESRSRFKKKVKSFLAGLFLEQ